MDIDRLPLIPSYSGGRDGPGRRPRGRKPLIIVGHTNEGAEHLTGAEDLAHYLAQPHPPDFPAYHIITDGNSAVRCADDMERVNGAGGVADVALHVCMIGFAAQSAVDWDDPFSRGAVALGSDAAHQWGVKWGIPMIRLAPSQVKRKIEPGVCGHVDVSAAFVQSQGHTDPGPNFPWAKFLGAPAPLVTKVEEMINRFVTVDRVTWYYVDGANQPVEMDGDLRDLYLDLGIVHKADKALKEEQVAVISQELFDKYVARVKVAQSR